MNTWKLTKAPLTQKKRKPRKKGRGELTCDCGKAAVAKAILQVGYDLQYTVTLDLCADCLAIEQGYKDTNQSVSIEMVNPPERG